jgi:hypothetical protein
LRHDVVYFSCGCSLIVQTLGASSGADQGQALQPETVTGLCGWIKRYIVFHDKRHPREMGKVEVEAFLGGAGSVGLACRDQ